MYKTYLNIIFLAAAIPVLGQDKLDADRPGETRSPELVKGNNFQAEFGFRREKLDDNFRLYQHPSATLRYGLFNAIELRAELISQSITDENNDRGSYGLRPINVGIKAKVLPEYKAFPSVAVLGHLGLPTTSSKDYYNRRLPVEIRTLFGNTISKKIKLQYNAGIKWEGEERHTQWMYTISPVLEMSDKLSVFVEQYAYLQKDNPAQHYFDGGLYYYISPNFVVDFSAGAGLSASSSDYFLSAGFSFRVR